MHKIANGPRRIPVILDTDIGSDIDDTWALVMMLKSPELDVKLITSTTRDTHYRAAIIAKLLEVARRQDIPVGVGIPRLRKDHPDLSFWTRRQKQWVRDYDLSEYPGQLYADGVDAMIEIIMASKEVVTLIAIGPLTNIAEALMREPAIAGKCRFVAMAGSIETGYGKEGHPVAECNIVLDVTAAQVVFSAPWHDMVLAPTDSSAQVVLRGAQYQAIENASDPLIRALIENYHIWLKNGETAEVVPPQQSSTLYDTVAIYLAFSAELLAMERMGIRISFDGYTVPDALMRSVNVAMGWKDIAAYETFLTERLLR